MTVITKESLAELRKMQWEAFHKHEPGEWFDEFSAKLEAVVSSKSASSGDVARYPLLRFGNKKSSAGTSKGTTRMTTRYPAVVVQALPGTGKTYLASNYPDLFVDFDDVFKTVTGEEHSAEAYSQYTTKKFYRNVSRLLSRAIKEGKTILTNRDLSDFGTPTSVYVGFPSGEDYLNHLSEEFAARDDLLAFGDDVLVQWNEDYPDGSEVLMPGEFLSDFLLVSETSDDDKENDHADEISYLGGWDKDVVDSFFQSSRRPRGAVPAAAILNGERYAAGMTIVTGGGNTGKTPFLHALAAELGGNRGYTVIRFGEPLSGYSSDIQSFLDELSIAVSHHKVIVIDSLKDIINSSTGAAAVGGLSRAAFSFLSDLGSIAATRGCMVLSAMNPSSGSDRVKDEVLEAVISNATTVILPENDMGASVTWKVLSRTGEGLLRKSWLVSMSYGDFSFVSIKADVSAKPNGNANPASTATQNDVQFGDEAVAAILKRY
nr:MAG: hypothetical protein 3 [Guangxi cystovirus 5]QYF49725.1 MAG: hypothetical protein 3 [Guangxi cystovirus 8]